MRAPEHRARAHWIESARLHAALRHTPRVAAMVAVVVTVGVLTSILPRRAPLVINTALMTLLSALSLFLLAPATSGPVSASASVSVPVPRSASARLAGMLCAAATVLVAGATLFEYLTGVSLGIDRGPGFPGRPSPHTATAFLLVGAALLALDRRTAGGPRPTELLALAAVSIPLTALLGYLLSMPELYGVPTIRPHTGMAIHSVVVLLIVCVGILAARPDVGVVSIVTAGHAGGVMARRLLLGLLALVPAAVLIKVGERLGWWLAPATAALLMVSVLAEGVTFILLTASRLGRDDTARRAVETELRRSEEKLQGIVSIATDAIISVDDDQRITLYNEGAQQIFGWLPGEILGKPLDVLIPERFRLRHSGHVRGFAGDPRRARKMGEQLPAIWGLRKNGEEFRADAAISRIEIDGARLYTVVLRDVGEHVRYIEEQTFLARVGEVLASSLSFRETLEHVSELVVSFVGDMCTIDLVEDDGGLRRLKIAHADPAKEALVEAVGRITPDPSHPEWRVLATKQPQLLTEVPPDLYRPVPRGGEPAGGAGDVSLTEALSLRSILAVPLNARGHLVGVLSIASCRAERRYGTADLRLAEELSRRVALALDNAHLYEVAQDAIQVRDRVLGVVAHDLRNPLNAILLNSDLMRRRAPEPERRSQRQVDGIRRAAVRMNRLIQDLLDIVRLEAGHLLIERHRVPSGALVAEAVEAARNAADASHLELHLELADGLPDLLADRDRLLQVFDNLIGNAIKFTFRGGRITVGAAPRNGETVFRVTDTGPGISDEDLPHLFDRFWQARKADRRGAGLGLPIVKGIVEAHGGRIWVETHVGTGTTFYFTVPVSLAREMSTADAAPSAPGLD